MCSPSVGSGTSWAQCASGSVNENGCAVCACVRAYGCGSVACDSCGGWRRGQGGEGMEEEEEEEEGGRRVTGAAVGLAPTAEPPRLKLYDKPSRINTALRLSLRQPGWVCLSQSFPSYIIIYSFL